MNTSRIFVKGLAVVIGVLGLLWALAGPLLLIASTFGYGRERLRQLDAGTLITIGGLAILVSVLGGLVAREAWKHLRRPDRGTAAAVIRLACFITGFEIFQLACRWLALREDAGIDRFRIQGLSGLLLAMVLLLFYRFLMKPLADRAFPTPEPRP